MIKKFDISKLVYIFTLISTDLLVILLSLKFALYLKINYFPDYLSVYSEMEIHKYYWVVFILLIILIFEKIYFIRYDFWSDTKRIYKGLILSFVAIFTVISLSKMSSDYSRAFLTLFFLVMFFSLPIFKQIVKRILFKFDFFKQKIKIVGKFSLLNSINEELTTNWYLGYKVVQKRYELVIIISKDLSIEDLERKIKRFSKFTRNIYIVPYMYHLDFTHTRVVDYFNIRLSAICIENRLLNYQNIFIKYLFEKCLVILTLPFALTVHIILTIIIKLDSKGNVIFKQKRFGKNGKSFSCYKYRSMYINGDEILKDYLLKNPDEVEYYKIYHKYQNDPRITKIGRILRATSLDEFPQFFNILRGDMNLIGPRPYMLNEKQKIGKINEEVILEVKPGITGLWQVSGRNNLTFEERVELDKWYIQNWSLWMDFIIFMKTIKVVLGKVGAR